MALVADCLPKSQLVPVVKHEVSSELMIGGEGGVAGEDDSGVLEM